MSSSSFTKTIDLTLKTLLYHKFGDILGINSQSSVEEDNINEGVIQLPKEVALRVIAEKRGENFLEFINFWRVGTSPSWGRQRTPLARRGMWLSRTEDKLQTTHIKAQPIDLNYNIWFWSKDLDKVYQCIERYILWQQQNPKISILYDDKWELTPDLHFGEIVDESTVPEQFETGLIFVYKLPIKIDGWVLEGFSIGTITKIVLKVYDKDDVTDYEEIIVEDSDQDTELEAILRMFKKSLYPIDLVDLVSNSIGIPNDRVSDFNQDDKIYIENSTGNDGRYTVVSVALVQGRTVITLSESLQSSVADGNIYKRE